ncbi:hypothetical protein EVAR_62480_1 [Eumeta japonica]|uniref:Uncharacterized protein n=1 Tax=Eumeta variegata TaxID=151549 RepID=A0A4C1ZL99_EUMVA|nr:hypothetical protein EVAR_62480_1 [Eumeta japonica]
MNYPGLSKSWLGTVQDIAMLNMSTTRTLKAAAEEASHQLHEQFSTPKLSCRFAVQKSQLRYWNRTPRDRFCRSAVDNIKTHTNKLVHSLANARTYVTTMKLEGNAVSRIRLISARPDDVYSVRRSSSARGRDLGSYVCLLTGRAGRHTTDGSLTTRVTPTTSPHTDNDRRPNNAAALRKPIPDLATLALKSVRAVGSRARHAARSSPVVAFIFSNIKFSK